MAKKLQGLRRKLRAVPRWAWWLAGLFLAAAAGVLLAYYWRVFYYLDARGWPALQVTAACAAGAALFYGQVSLILYKVKDFHTRAVACIALCGLLFVFASPPLQVPDEGGHFLRAWTISEGHLNFNGARGYPESVDRLMNAFPGAWVSAHTSAGVRVDPDGNGKVAPQPIEPNEDGLSYGPANGYESFDSSGYALKQYGENGPVTGVADGFAVYFSNTAAPTVTEPILRQILPYLLPAAAMALGRLFGLGALGCLYAGRLANLAVYVLLCAAALKACRRYRPVFLAVMLLPLSLYLAGSMNYDAILLGCYFLAASYYCRDSLNDRDLWIFAVNFWVIHSMKPWINLLWLAVPLVLPRAAWKARMKRWQLAVLCVVPAILIARFVDWYGIVAMVNYGEIGRTIEGADQLRQLLFILKNPLRYAAVLLGTLYENSFYLGKLGVFGSLDLSIEVLNLLSPCMLVLGAALSGHQKATLRPVPAIGLGALALVYAAGAVTALYITYTPVGMVRVIGMQARYLLPVFLMLAILLAALLSHVLQPKAGTAAAERVALGCFAGCGALGALLLFQHYFVGPVYTI